jgi:hypothetical protein
LEPKEKKEKLEEVEKAYKAQLQEERCQREKGKWKATEVKEDDKEKEKEPSSSNKKVSDWIFKEDYYVTDKNWIKVKSSSRLMVPPCEQCIKVEEECRQKAWGLGCKRCAQ